MTDFTGRQHTSSTRREKEPRQASFRVQKPKRTSHDTGKFSKTWTKSAPYPKAAPQRQPRNYQHKSEWGWRSLPPSLRLVDINAVLWPCCLSARCTRHPSAEARGVLGHHAAAPKRDTHLYLSQ